MDDFKEDFKDDFKIWHAVKCDLTKRAPHGLKSAFCALKVNVMQLSANALFIGLKRLEASRMILTTRATESAIWLKLAPYGRKGIIIIIINLTLI